MEPWLIVCLLGAVILVYSLLLPKESGEKSKPHLMKEIEDTIENFATEIEEENRELVKLFSNMKEDYERQTSTLLKRIELLERQGSSLGQELLKQTAEPAPNPVEYKAVVEPTQAEPVLERKAEPELQEEELRIPTFQENIRERYKELFSYYEQGKSVEFIAKKLEMNKGEVQLILQLSRQGAAFHV